MRIGEAAKAVGIDIQTARYYEKIGLVPPAARLENGYRTYGPEHIERLAFIRHCRALDISIDDIRQLVSLLSHPERECGEVNQIIDHQLIRVQARLASLHALERQLTALRSHCGEAHTVKACGILHELVTAAHGEACACHLNS